VLPEVPRRFPRKSREVEDARNRCAKRVVDFVVVSRSAAEKITY
jgi:hypothetical protein